MLDSNSLLFEKLSKSQMSMSIVDRLLGLAISVNIEMQNKEPYGGIFQNNSAIMCFYILTFTTLSISCLSEYSEMYFHFDCQQLLFDNHRSSPCN